MFNKMNFEKNIDGSYNLLIYYSTSNDTEFGLDLLNSDKLKNNANNVLGYLKRAAKKMKISAVKIIINGVIVSTLSLSTFMNVYGAESSKYSMAYLYLGTPTQQISYITRTNGALNTVSPSYFDLNTDGSLRVNNISNDLINYAHSIGVNVIPFLSNHWNRDVGIAALNNAEALSTELANYISQYNLDGVNIDIENVTEQHRSQYVDFVSKLRSKLPASKEVSVAVAANPKGWLTGWHGSYDYTNLAANSDHLVIMAYDEHWQGSEPGPVSSISFVENSIKYALTKTTASKIVVGLPFYGRIWSQDNSFNGNGITLDRVNQIISTYTATVSYDSTHKSAKAIFTIKSSDELTTLNGKTLTAGTYTIWYENEASIEAKMALINKYDLKGAGAWSLGQEHTGIWENYSNWLNPKPTETPVVPTPPPIKVVSRTGIVTAGVLNVRSGPSTRYRAVGTLRKSSLVNILNTKNGWHTIKLPSGKTAYVSSSYISEKSAPSTTKSTSRTGIITARISNIRSGPSTKHRIIGTLRKNASVNILSTKNGWHTIRLPNGQTAYVSSSVVNIK